MNAPDPATAVEIAVKAMNAPHRLAPAYAQDAVAALDAAKLLRRPDEAAYVAALEAVAEAAWEVSNWHAQADETYAPAFDALDAALDAVPAAGSGSGGVWPESVWPAPVGTATVALGDLSDETGSDPDYPDVSGGGVPYLPATPPEHPIR